MQNGEFKSTCALAKGDELLSGQIHCTSQKAFEHKLKLEFYGFWFLHTMPLKKSCTAFNK